MDELKYYYLTTENVNTLNDCIDTTFRQTGMEHLQDINALIHQCTSNVIKKDAAGSVIGMSVAGVNVAKLLTDIEIKANGIASIGKVASLLVAIGTPVEPPIVEDATQSIETVQEHREEK